MKNIIKKYYEMDNETKEMLEAFYMFHELESTMEDYENVNLKLGDEETLLEMAMLCTYLTNLGPDEIIKRLLQILDCRDITVNDLIELESDELIELMQNVDDDIIEDEDDLEIVKQFIYSDLFCLLLKDNYKYILICEKNNNAKVVIFNDIEQLLSIIEQVEKISEIEN